MLSKDSILQQIQESPEQALQRSALDAFLVGSFLLAAQAYKRFGSQYTELLLNKFTLAKDAIEFVAPSSDAYNVFSRLYYSAVSSNQDLHIALARQFAPAITKTVELLKRTQADTNQIKLLTSLASWLKKPNFLSDSEAYLKQARIFAEMDSDVAKMLDIKVSESDKQVADTLADLAETLKKENPKLKFNKNLIDKDSIRLLKEMRGLGSDAASSYIKQLDNAKKAEKRAFSAAVTSAKAVLDSEGREVKLISSQDLANYFEQHNVVLITFNPDWPFLYSFDSIYTKFNERLDFKLSQLADKRDYRFEVNPDYQPGDSSWYFRFVHDKLDHSDSENKTPFYTEKSRNDRATAKRDAIYTLIEMLPELQKKWRKDLGSDDEETHLKALMLDVLFWSSCRSGHGDGNTGGQTTYGLSVWRRKHVHIKPNFNDKPTLFPAVDVIYQGKDNQPQHHVFKMNGTPVATLLAMQYWNTRKDKNGLRKGDDYFWVVPSTGVHITAQKLQTYLRKLTGVSEITLHKFRHARGTRLALKALESFNLTSDNSSISEIEKGFQHEMLAVGKALGHYNKGEVTWRTAVVNYVDPLVSKAFFTKAGISPPPVVQAELDALL